MGQDGDGGTTPTRGNGTFSKSIPMRGNFRFSLEG
jgi:hypothetical protein